ncbi:MAG: hypothetical protein AUK28_01005 [Desulfobacterales bacterium CG2_30_60_27]|nr:MAG: hypothetical protein AUK28_01005 [Desulfobacterales bacterium CG2_30_60_27]
MKREHPCLAALLVGALCVLVAWTTARAAEGTPIPRANTVTLVDLGGNCKPCQMMAPLLDELAKEYAGRADVIFIDLGNYPEKAKEFNVSIKPTQIFFDRNGKEKMRHQGFLGKVFMANILDDLLKDEAPEVDKP